MSAHRKAAGAAAFVLAVAMSGCASAEGSMTGAATPQMVAAGQTAYAESCAGCHGAAGEGTPRAPNLADDQHIWLDAQVPMRAQLVWILRNGIPAPRVHTSGMPPVGSSMSDEQVHAIAAYVESL